ncbi:conserved Plasmodium protein, unknown function, partial [Plasmodium malariae]
IHNIRTLLLTCISGSVSNLLHNTVIDEKKKCFYVNCDSDIATNTLHNTEVKNENKHYVRDDERKENINKTFSGDEYFLNKCKTIYYMRKSLQNAHIKTNDNINLKNNILDCYI